MSYLLKSNRRKKGLRGPLTVVALTLAVAALFYFLLPNFGSESVYGFARPLWKVRDALVRAVEDLRTLFESNENLASENEALRQKNEEADLALLSLYIYKRENEELKKLLGREPQKRGVLATVLAKPSASLYDTLILDAGSETGVETGDLVRAGDFVLGTVREVSGKESKAVLASAPGEVWKAEIGERHIATDFFGRGAGNFLARLPREVSISVGDMIILPALSPRPLAVVEAVEETETGSFKFIFAKLPINIQELRFVEMIKK